MRPTLDELTTWAAQSGDLLSTYFRNGLTIRHKGRFDLVTQADTASETLLIDSIRARYPDHTLITEESGRLEGSGGTWYIDPLDGTINFAHGLPIYSVTLAYAEGGQVLLGVVYDPTRGEMYAAERGQGAFLNGRRLHVSEAGSLDQSLLVTGFPYDAYQNRVNNLDEFAHFARLTQGVRRLGSAALDLCYVAGGFIDGYWELRISAWDIAAGTLMVEEAGGVVSDISGGADFLRPPCSVVAGNAAIHAELMRGLERKK